MVSSRAATVAEYLESLPEERREVVAAVRKVIRKHLPKGYREAMNWGMICYEVPLSVHPTTYNGQPLCYAGLAAQKNHFAVYLMGVYGDTEVARRFKEGFAKAGKKLDMGKSCVRFKKLEDVPLDVIGEAIGAIPPDKFVAFVEKAHAARRRTSSSQRSRSR
jgi:hypothetical protein